MTKALLSTGAVWPRLGDRTRVLFALPNLSRGGDGNVQGGPEGVIATLLHNVDRTQFEVGLAVHDASTSNLLNELTDVVVLSVLRPGARRTRLWGRYPVPEFLQLLRQTKPDVVMTTLRMDVTAAAARRFFPANTALVSRICNNISGTLETQRSESGALKSRAAALAHKFVLSQADVLIAQSSAMAADIREHARGDVSGKLFTVPNPVPTSELNNKAKWPPAPIRQSGDPQLVTVGRLHRQKGYDLLLPAFARVLQHQPTAKLWIIGDGPDRSELERLAATLGLDDAVTFLGFLENPAPYVASADLYVCSSRYEGFSNALAEALALGTPAVAPAGPAAGEELIQPQCGELIGPVTQDRLVEGINKALGRPFDREAVKASIADRFSVPRVVSLYEQILLEAAGRRTS